MILRRRHNLILALHVQSRGFAFAIFESWLAPVDWGVQEVRGQNKNLDCLQRITSLLELHTPDVLVLENTSTDESRRALRIQRLNSCVAKHAELHGIAVCTYSRAQLNDSFADQFGATTKHRIAETIAVQVPALGLYLPPRRKAWMREHSRMGLFQAAALAWMYFNRKNG
jgi:hypothetical protein